MGTGGIERNRAGREGGKQVRRGGEKGIFWTLDVNVNVDIDIGTHKVDSGQCYSTRNWKGK